MKTWKIAVIPGDGVGPEVVAEGMKLLKQVARMDGAFAVEDIWFPWGCEYYLKRGRMMDEDGMERLKDFDAIFLGAVGAPGVPDHISLWDLLLTIRKGFDQYVNLRPVKLLSGAPCPLKGVKKEEVNMTFIRENSEGEYAGSGSWLYRGKPQEVVIQDGVFSRAGCERIIRYAFETARRERRSLTSVSKANALNYSMVFWDQIFDEVSREYPDVETHAYLVDPSMFEPIHGSAPDIAGRGIANPMAAVWSVSQMLDFFGYEEWGARILVAIERVLVKGEALTPDLGGTSSTQEVGNAILKEI